MDVARKRVNVEKVFNEGKLTGRGITVAVVDTGVYPHTDFLIPYNRLLKQVDYVGDLDAPYDDNGHGTHVAGIIGGNGISSDGKYMGIAPDVNLLSVKVLNKKGGGKTSDVLAGLQWVMDNRNKYNIRIVNISLGGDDHKGEESSIVKAVDHLWDNGIIVVTAAGNKGPRSRTITTPGISRKIITVGCSNDHETVNINGDFISNYSSRGPTRACIIKPDVVAPGANIISCASKENYKPMERLSREDSKYEAKSGTSMAAPMVSGAIALLLQSNPYLSPNEVKLKLSRCCDDLGFKKNHQGWGLINIEKLMG
ncbi:S8 family peptidase [Vallitalea okinawensis]|uniref:S8 family peptidase n=1 Tax=Vallitalea okinawensis TaxID=2078660 RepID=UPI000CFA90E9